MNSKLSALILSLVLFVSIVYAINSDKKVEVVVVGMISHGPMQPTVNAIKEVTSKYPEVTVKWLDLETPEGQRFAREHGLTAHLTVLINGKFKYNVNGREVTFQWFEGQLWKKEDLDYVIQSLLRGDSEVSPADTVAKGSGNVVNIAGVLLAVAGIVALLLLKKSSRR